MKTYLKKFGNKANSTLIPTLVAFTACDDEELPKSVACDDSDDEEIKTNK